MEAAESSNDDVGFDIIEDDEAGEIPADLVATVRQYLPETTRISIQRRSGPKGYEETGKRVDIRGDVDVEDITRVVWLLCLKHAEYHGEAYYRAHFIGTKPNAKGNPQVGTLTMLKFFVPVPEEEKPTTPEEAMVSVVNVMRQTLGEFSRLYLEVCKRYNDVASHQNAAMKHLTETKIAEMWFAERREERTAEAEEAAEQARADAAKWAAFGSIGTAMGTRIGDVVVGHFNDLLQKQARQHGTVFRALWARFPAKKDLLGFFDEKTRAAWEAMVDASNEEQWTAKANAFREGAVGTTMLGDAVQFLAAKAGTDLPAWMELARRAGWMFDATGD